MVIGGINVEGDYAGSGCSPYHPERQSYAEGARGAVSHDNRRRHSPIRPDHLKRLTVPSHRPLEANPAMQSRQLSQRTEKDRPSGC